MNKGKKKIMNKTKAQSNKLSPAVEKRFDEATPKFVKMENGAIIFVEFANIKFHLADELAIQKKELTWLTIVKGSKWYEEFKKEYGEDFKKVRKNGIWIRFKNKTGLDGKYFYE